MGGGACCPLSEGSTRAWEKPNSKAKYLLTASNVHVRIHDLYSHIQYIAHRYDEDDDDDNEEGDEEEDEDEDDHHDEDDENADEEDDDDEDDFKDDEEEFFIFGVRSPNGTSSVTAMLIWWRGKHWWGMEKSQLSQKNAWRLMAVAAEVFIDTVTCHGDSLADWN